jgi:S1-C subfamily serine protease
LNCHISTLYHHWRLCSIVACGQVKLMPHLWDNIMNTNWSRLAALVPAAVVLGFGGTGALAQDSGALTRNDAVLVVDGVVREVFRSPRQERVDYLVQIEVKRSQADRAPRTPARVAMPAPGEMVYVHVSQRSGAAAGQGIAGRSDTGVVPAERSQVRAYLAPGTSGGWEGAGNDWFEPASTVLAEGRPNDPPPASPEPAPSAPGPRPETAPAGGKSALSVLGFTGESLNVKGQFVLRVSSVEQGGLAQRAGLEVGDIVIGANDKALSGLDQLQQVARQGALKNLVVLDVNTGKAVRVPVEQVVANGSSPASESPPAATRPDAPAAPAPTGTSRSLGISAEPVTVGPRTAMKVIRVEPGGPAQKAGIEVGDVIVAANGVPVTGVEVLSAVLKKSGPSLTVSVRDSRTGRDVPVEIKFGGPEAANPAPAPVDPQLQTTGGRKLGAVTELVFYDVNPAVKVTEVEPASPAARSGLEPGDIIVEANGTPVLHPKTLDEVVRKSAAVLKLIVVDPRTNKKTPVEVNLGGG